MNSTLANLRIQMEQIDEHLIITLAARQALARKILAWKKRCDMALHMPDIEWTILRRVSKLAEEHDLDPAFVRNLYFQILGKPFEAYDL